MPKPGNAPRLMGLPMLRGEIRLTNLDPAVAGEASKRRPAVVVSNDHANAIAARLGRGVVTVVPITSNLTHVYPFQVLLPARETGVRVDSKAQAEQVRAVSVERLGPVVGRIPAQLMAALDDALRLHLQL
jgi:mRNA interferase MazF